MKRLTAVVLVLVMTILLLSDNRYQKVEAASQYITVSEYMALLGKEIGLELIEGNETHGYIFQLNNRGIIKDGEFKEYNANLSRGDMLLLLNRTEEFLYGTQTDAELVQLVIDKRISDIKKVPASKREDIAKGFIKGFLKGFSKGNYTQYRYLKLTGAVLKTDAINILNMLRNKSLRNKISPDGQLIRTTNLPNNAYMFPYILANFPNRFYEGRLEFEGVTTRVNGVLTQMKSPEDYTYPVDLDKSECGSIFINNQGRYMDFWVDKVYTRVWNTFNVDYRTIDDKWIDTMAKTDMSIFGKDLYEDLNKYVMDMKKNKTIVECDKAVIEPSALYFNNGLYYIRCYVRYKIVSTNTKTKYTVDEMLVGLNKTPYNSILFSNTYIVNLSDYKLGQWVDGIFDIAIASPVNGMDGETYGVAMTYWSTKSTRPYERN
jgi:hypothetical protein